MRKVEEMKGKRKYGGERKKEREGRQGERERE